LTVRAMVVRQFGAPEQMSFEDLPAPEPGPEEVLIEARAIGVNFPDLLVIEGKYQNLPELPFCPGKEVSGSSGRSDRASRRARRSASG
jgi:NADPH:quinone reductase